jgi:hypothetical protein
MIRPGTSTPRVRSLVVESAVAIASGIADPSMRNALVWAAES